MRGVEGHPLIYAAVLAVVVRVVLYLTMFMKAPGVGRIHFPVCLFEVVYLTVGDVSSRLTSFLFGLSFCPEWH